MRPTKYRAEFSAQARKLCQLGATDIEIADFLEVDVRTLYRWKNDHDEFCQALKEGKTEADARVEASLYHKAVGYSFDAVKIFMPAGAKEPVHAPYREHVAPDTTAAIFWLKNRQPDRWRDKHEIEHTNRPADMTDDELTRIAAGSGEGVASKANGSSKPH